MTAPMILVVALALQPQPAEGRAARRANQQATAGAPRTPAQPLDVTVTVPPRDPKEVEQDRKDRQREIAIQGQIGTYTGLLFGLGVLQVVASGYGLYLTRRAADAAKTSAEVAERALHISERAYLLMDNWQLRDDGATVSVTCDLRNTGRTPARIADRIYKIGVPYSGVMPDIPDYADSRNEGAQSMSGGQRLLFQTQPETIPPDVFIDIQQGIATLFIWGIFRYTDQFGQPHRYGFGFKVDRATKQLKLITVSAGFEGYNYAD
jgi:hypothetical protein